MKTRLLFVMIALLLFCALPVWAQESGVSAGLAYTQSGDPATITGWGTFDKQIKGALYSYNGAQVIPVYSKEKVIPQIKIRAFSGVAADTATFGRFKFFTQGAVGVSSTSDQTAFMGNVGGFIHGAINKNWGIIAGIQGAFSEVDGKDMAVYWGVRYGIGGK